jgi:hypothetical protein
MAHDDVQTTSSVEQGIQRLVHEVENHVRGIVHELMQSAGAERLAAMREARAAADADAQRILADELARARTQAAEMLEKESARLRAEHAEHLSSELHRLQSEAAALTASEVVRVRTEVTSAFNGEIERVKTDAASLREHELGRVRAEADQRLAEEIARTRQEEDRRLKDEIQRIATEGEARLREALQRAHVEAAARLQAEVTRARGEERQVVLLAFDRLLRAVRRLDEAQALTELLDALSDAVAEEAPRVAVLVVHGARLQSWRASGFPATADRRMDVPVTESGIVARVLETGETTSTSSHPGSGGLSPAPVPPGRVALAVPVRVGGRVVAVVYADDVTDTEGSVPAPWPETIELLARHAGKSLEALTALKAAQAGSYRAGATAQRPQPAQAAAAASVAQATSPRGSMDDEARRYAQRLVGDIKLRHESAVMAGRQQRDLLQRLRPEIEQARRVYEDQVPPSVAARRLYFDQEVLRTLANGDPTLLG